VLQQNLISEEIQEKSANIMHIFCQGDKFLIPNQKIILVNQELTLLFENEKVL